MICKVARVFKKPTDPFQFSFGIFSILYSIILGYWSFMSQSKVLEREKFSEFIALMFLYWIHIVVWLVDSCLVDFLSCTEYYLSFYSFDTERERENVMKYCRGKKKYFRMGARILFLAFYLYRIRLVYRIGHFVKLVESCNRYVEEDGEISKAETIVSGFFSFPNLVTSSACSKLGLLVMPFGSAEFVGN